MKKTLFSIVAAGISSLLFAPLALGASFPDIKGHRYENAIEHIAGLNLVDGYKDKTFRPNNTINRAEIILIVLKQKHPNLPAKKCFSDVTSNLWFSKFACKGRELGVVKGYPDGAFRGANKLIFVEALLIMQRAYGIPVQTQEGPEWFKESVESARGMGIIPPDITRMDQKVTRAQVAEMLSRLIQYQTALAQNPQQSSSPPPSSPVSLPLPSQSRSPAPAPMPSPAPSPTPSPAPSPAPAPVVGPDGQLPLLQFEDLVYQGAFRLPSGTFGSSTFGYAGTALAFNHIRDSLYLVGHDHQQMVSEISIPEIIKSDNLDDLKVATVLQKFADASDGKMKSVDTGTIKVGGLLVYDNKLYGSAFDYYDANKSQVLSHFISPLDLSGKSDAQGMFQLGELGAGFVSGYMAHIPEEWQDDLGGPALVGQCCIAIVSRTSSGPSAFVFHPEDIGVKNPVPVTPLVYYTPGKPLGEWDQQNPYFNGSTKIKSIVFPPGTRSILYFGSHGTGPFCYGTVQECPDPVSKDKGVHAPPYLYQIWAYDVLDFIEAKKGNKKPWEIKPYGVWNFELPYPKPQERKGIPGATFDPKTGRLYVEQRHGDGDRPVVHVYTIKPQ